MCIIALTNLQRKLLIPLHWRNSHPPMVMRNYFIKFPVLIFAFLVLKPKSQNFFQQKKLRRSDGAAGDGDTQRTDSIISDCFIVREFSRCCLTSKIIKPLRFHFWNFRFADVRRDANEKTTTFNSSSTPSSSPISTLADTDYCVSVQAKLSSSCQFVSLMFYSGD